MKRLIATLGAGLIVLTALPAVVSAAAPPAAYFNGFETAADVGATNQAMFSVSQVTTGPGAITSASGDYHALAAVSSGAFTRYGGYSSTFPAGGYTTSADIYLDTALSTSGTDLRFDWSSAINDASGTFRRDFVFNVGTNGTGGFVMSASNNAGRSGADPSNPGRSPYTISTSGWYTFQHHFYNGGSGVLAADLTVRAFGSATALQTWTLSDPTDVVGTTVGGNRYGWLVNNELELAMDNITRSGVLPKCTATGFFRDGINLTAAQIGGTVTGTLDATTCNIGAYNPTSVSGATIFGANYFGVVANGGTLSVTDSSVGNIGEVPFNGSQHGIGIYFTGASGTISGNAVSLYQKGGIVARDGGTVTIDTNTVTGAGPITYIAQNGIQVSFGTSARLFDNNVSLNNYTPAKVTACGLLIYRAGGVSGLAKAGISYIKADNKFHDNETDICNFGKGGGFQP